MDWDDDEDDFFEDIEDEACEHLNLDVDVITGLSYCGRCGFSGSASKAEIEAEMRYQAEYQQSVAEEHAPEYQRAGRKFDMTEWQPIETAPKDGTPVLLTIKGHILEPDEDTHCDIGRWSEEATDWMPIPAPPGEVA